MNMVFGGRVDSVDPTVIEAIVSTEVTEYLAGLNIEEQQATPDSVFSVQATLPLVGDLPVTGMSGGDKFLLSGDNATYPYQIAEYEEVSPGVFDYSYSEIPAGDNFLLLDDRVATFNGNELLFQEPEDVEILFEIAQGAFLAWDGNSWAAKIYSSIVATKNLSIYIDTISGSDANDGSLSNPYRSLEAAMSFVSSRVDFVGKYTVFYRILSDVNSVGIIRIPVHKNIKSSSSILIIGHNGIKTIQMSKSTLFWTIDPSTRLLLQRIRISGEDINANSKAIRSTSGTITIKDCEVTGKIGYAIEATFRGNIVIKKLRVSNLNCYALRNAVSTSLIIDTEGAITFAGENTFLEAFDLADGQGRIVSSGVFSYEEGAIVSGAKFNQRFSSIVLTDTSGDEPLSSVAHPGDQPGVLYGGGGSYNGKSNYPLYSHLNYGGSVAIATDPTKLDLPEVEYLIYQLELPQQKWLVCSQPQGQINFPSLLSVNQEAYLYVDAEGYGWDTAFPTELQLRERIYLAIAQSENNTSFSDIYPILLQLDPNTSRLLFYGGVKNDQILPEINGSSIEINGGAIEVAGINYWSDPTQPNLHVIAKGMITFDLLDPDGGEIATNQTELNFSQYWDDGLQLVAQGGACWQFLYYCPFRAGSKWVVILGQAEYPIFETALSYGERSPLPSFLGLCSLFGLFCGNEDGSKVTSFSNLFSDRNIPTTIGISGLPSSSSSVEKETLTGNKTLTVSSSNHQELTNQSGADLIILLPSNPPLGLTFLIANSAESTNNLIVDNVSVVPDSIHEVRWVGHWKII